MSCPTFNKYGACCNGYSCEEEHDTGKIRKLDFYELSTNQTHLIIEMIQACSDNILALDTKLNFITKELNEIKRKHIPKEINTRVKDIYNMIDTIPALIRSQGLPLSALNTTLIRDSNQSKNPIMPNLMERGINVYNKQSNKPPTSSSSESTAVERITTSADFQRPKELRRKSHSQVSSRDSKHKYQTRSKSQPRSNKTESNTSGVHVEMKNQTTQEDTEEDNNNGYTTSKDNFIPIPISDNIQTPKKNLESGFTVTSLWNKVLGKTPENKNLNLEYLEKVSKEEISISKDKQEIELKNIGSQDTDNFNPEHVYEEVPPLKEGLYQNQDMGTIPDFNTSLDIALETSNLRETLSGLK